MIKLIDDDVRRYSEEAGPEPVIDRKEPDMAAQYVAWREWWWEWYQRPIKRSSPEK